MINMQNLFLFIYIFFSILIISLQIYIRSNSNTSMSDIFFDEDPYFQSPEQQLNQQENDQNMDKKAIQNQQCQNSSINNLSQSKTIHKNKYINKIKDINPDLTLEKTIPIKEGNESIGSMDKKQRNKYSAKQSRDRKKLYIQILQQKQKNLSKQLLSKKKQLQQTKNYLDRVINQNKTMSGFTVGRHQMIKKLQNLLMDTNISEEARNQQIIGIINNLRYRIGATGKQRINTINQYFRQIVNLSLPALHRYMMWSATQQKHLFSKSQSDQNDQWFKQLKKTLNLSEQQKQQILSKQTFLKQQKLILEQLIGDLKKVKNEIEEKSIQLQDLIDQIREILTPVQCAQFILFIQKNKYRKQLNLCEKLSEQDPGTRKMVKRQQE